MVAEDLNSQSDSTLHTHYVLNCAFPADIYVEVLIPGTHGCETNIIFLNNCTIQM